ncbi:unnamed protein product [Allacma fusca]|uniref:Uncharacterized protein n=1 Tax=Allacma fusca TaxID=39272 RepID=A0A8J2KTV7_9HEXA|nr:unnamed protein product [Allacma fusca]
MGNSLMNLSVPAGVSTTVTGVATSEPFSYNQPQQASFRGFLSRHEGPIGGPHRGIVSGIHHSGLHPTPGTGSVFPPSTTISFANSFAHYPSFANQTHRPPPNSDLGSVNLEASSLNMCVDALYIHELHHLELRRRGSRASVAGFGLHSQASPLGTSAYQGFSTQPGIHSPQPTQTTSRFETEKTPLLHSSHLHPFT